MPGTDDNPMTAIFDRHATDKNSLFHNYTHYYHRYLQPYTGQAGLRYLEIGVFRGNSLRAFREYFPLAERLVGIDIDNEAARHADPANGIFIEIGHQADTAFLESVVDKHGEFDVILDDGSHRIGDIVASFQTLFPRLRDGGLYVVEDTVCVRDSLHYFFGLTRTLNRQRGDQPGGDNCVDPEKINITVADPVQRSVGDIVFTNSAIIIHKREKIHWRPV